MSAETLSGRKPAHGVIDLGTHRFKDIDEAEHILQLVVPGIPGDFPPIRSLDARPNNLPAQPSTFVGRTRETEEISDLIESSRVVTIGGPGGVGKTRLAIHVASLLLPQFEHGVVYVPLDAIRDESLVVGAIASALDLEEDPDRSTFELITDRVAGQRLLLVVDNFEHVRGAATDVAAILQAAPGVRLSSIAR